MVEVSGRTVGAARTDRSTAARWDERQSSHSATRPAATSTMHLRPHPRDRPEDLMSPLRTLAVPRSPVLTIVPSLRAEEGRWLQFRGPDVHRVSRTRRRFRNGGRPPRTSRGRRPAGARLVVADCVARPGVRHLGDQPRCFQGAVHRHLRQRLRRGADEAGTARRGGQQACHRPRHRVDRGDRRYPLHGVCARCQDRQGPLGARSASRTAVRRPPPQEHLRVRDTGDRWRAGLRASFGGNVGIFCYSMDGALLWKHSWPPQPIYLDFGTASSPVVHDGRVYQLHDNDGEGFFAALDARTGKQLWSVTRTDNAPMKSGWATPFVWRERIAHGDRHHRARAGGQLRRQRQGALAAQGHDAGDPQPGRGGRVVVCRLGVAG
jgi:hypothetical protein